MIPYHYVQLSRKVRDDLGIWESFLDLHNGHLVWIDMAVSSLDLELYTDASRACGYDTYIQGQWPDSWGEARFVENLALLQLFPIVVATEIWGERLQNRRV